MTLPKTREDAHTPRSLARRRYTNAEVAKVANLRARGLSYAKIAEQTGIPLTTVYRWMTQESKGIRHKLKPCGTNAAYRRHLEAGEIADEACLEAHRKEQQKWSRKKARKREVKAAAMRRYRAKKKSAASAESPSSSRSTKAAESALKTAEAS